MKTLALARPLILILVGLPGAGKSFFARQFSEMFSAPLVSYDRLRFELFDKPTLSANEQDLLQRLANYQISELVKTRRSFLVDGGGNTRAERQKLDQFAKQHDYETLIIWVQTDTATCRQRAAKRNAKQQSNELSVVLTPAQWDSAGRRFAQPNRESYMVISGKHAFSTQAKMVLRKLTTPHVQEAETAHQVERKQTARPNPRPQRPPLTGSPARRSVLIS